MRGDYSVKTSVSITDSRGDKICFTVGPEINESNSSVVASRAHGCISIGTFSPSKLRVVYVEYEQLPWRIQFTDQAIIDRVQKLDKGYWMPRFLHEAMLAATVGGQLRFIIERTIAITREAAIADGRKQKLNELLAVLEIPKDRDEWRSETNLV